MDQTFVSGARCVPAAAVVDHAGAPVRGKECLPEPLVTLPLAMMNRHGLVAGATGTGKTKTLQLVAEQLSAQGVPVFLADIKGDLSGIAMPGTSNDRLAQRATETGFHWTPRALPSSS